MSARIFICGSLGAPLQSAMYVMTGPARISVDAKQLVQDLSTLMRDGPSAKLLFRCYTSRGKKYIRSIRAVRPGKVDGIASIDLSKPSYRESLLAIVEVASEGGCIENFQRITAREGSRRRRVGTGPHSPR